MRAPELVFTFPADRTFRHRSLKVSEDQTSLTKVCFFCFFITEEPRVE